MAETDSEKTGADVREPAGERPAPDFKKWRKDDGLDGLKLRTLRGMKAAEAMLYSAETRDEAAHAIRLLTQAAQAHRRVLRDEHRAEVETQSVVTAAQVHNFAVRIVTAGQEVFAEYDVPEAAQQMLADRVREAVDVASTPPELLD